MRDSFKLLMYVFREFLTFFADGDLLFVLMLRYLKLY